MPALARNAKKGGSDHVEIDFRSHTGSFNRKSYGLSPSNTNTSEYMEMHPSSNPIQNEKSDYVEMGVNLSKTDRCPSKPIEIIKKKNDKFPTHDLPSSSLHMDEISENETHHTIFSLSLENCTLDSKLENDQQKNDRKENSPTEHDEGEYATLLPTNLLENKEEQLSCKQNYVDLYFPEQNSENVTTHKKEENNSKSTYAQIVFSDIQPK